jgi:hypothetical protein
MKKSNEFSIFRLRSAVIKPIQKDTVLTLVTLIFLLFLTNCGHYYKVRDSDNIINPDTKTELNLKGKYVILRDGNMSYNFYNIDIKGDTMKGYIRVLSFEHKNHLQPKREKGNRYKKSIEPGVINEVHIHVADSSIIYSKGRIVSLPLSSIQKIQVYEKDGTTTALSWILPPVLTIGVVAAIVAATSCPFIYTYDGENYQLAGEIYGGATYPSLERHDYLPLPDFKPINGAYQLKIANELKEIQYTNMSELFIVQHPYNTSVLIDKYGKAQSYAAPQAPRRAITDNGTDVTLSVRKKNDKSVFAFDDKGTGNHVNGLILTFINNENVSKAKLIIRAKNSVWADYAYGKFSNLFGTYYEEWNNDQKKLSTRNMKINALDQDVPLSVYLEGNNGWQFLDYYDVVGPIAYREMVIPIDLSKANSEIINIKLETGYKFWEIEYAAMDFTESTNVCITKLPLLSAIDENGLDVKDLISENDKQYLIQPDIGNEAILQFAEPYFSALEKQNMKTSVFLHSKGYYERIRKYDNDPDWISLVSHKGNHSFSKYSYNEYQAAKETKILSEELQE